MSVHPFPSSGYMPPQVVDKRNFLLEKAQPVSPFPSSYKTDISAIPIFHQQKVPDCVENAVTFVKKYHEYKSTGQVLDLSRRFLAIWTVRKDGFPLSEGTAVSNALYEAHKRGIAETKFLADDHSLDIKTFSDYAALTPIANNNGVQHTITSYAFLQDNTSDGLKNAIYQNGLVIVGALINKNWWTAKGGDISWESNDILPIRPPTTHDPKIDPSLSGHAFVLYGYDENYFYFVNSFGTDWGDAGRGYFAANEVPYVYESAVIVDLTPAQIEGLKQATEDVQQVETVINHDPSPVVQSVLMRILTLISQYVANLFKRG